MIKKVGTSRGRSISSWVFRYFNNNHILNLQIIIKLAHTYPYLKNFQLKETGPLHQQYPEGKPLKEGEKSPIMEMNSHVTNNSTPHTRTFRVAQNNTITFNTSTSLKLKALLSMTKNSP